MRSKTLILIGKRINRLLIVSFSHNSKGQYYFKCVCDCGVQKIIRGVDIMNNLTKSCGCLNKEQIKLNSRTHGMEGTKTYWTWQRMKGRCLRKYSIGYHNYGGRGIKVCDRWLNSFENFYADMGLKPEGKSIDRIDNNGNYTPENCRWATQKEQANNTRSNVRITLNGKTRTISQWLDRTNQTKSLFHRRRKLGWSIRKALMTPTYKPRKLTINNTTRTIVEWALLSGVTRKTVVNRLNQGASPEQALRPAYQ